MINIPKTKHVAIFIPSFGRAGELYRVIENLYENTPAGYFYPYLILESFDQESIKATPRLRCGVIINEGSPCYADAINTAYRKTREPYFFTGADDLGFHKGWLEKALGMMKGSIKVVGTNDLGSVPIGESRDSTHYLVSRDYIQNSSGVIDQPNTVLHNYKHNFTDTEFVETAKSRGVYTYAPESKAEHNHWAWGKARMDDTYRKGLGSNSQDEQTYHGREHLWTK